MIKKLSQNGAPLRFCYEACPAGYGLQRQILAAGHDCEVVAPSLIPRRAGERVKTNRHDAVSAAKRQRISARPMLDPAAAFCHLRVWRRGRRSDGVGPSSMAATLHLLFATEG